MTIPFGVVPEYNSLDSLYCDGHVFAGFYTDPDYTEEFTENMGAVADVYVKWESTPFVFEYKEWSQKYELTAIATTEDIDTLEIPSVCNLTDLTLFGIDWSEGTGYIGKLILPETMDIVTQSTFFDCNRVGEVVIPKGVDIGYRAFEDCDITVTLAEDNTKYAYESGVIYDMEKGTVVSFTANFSESITVPSGITDIDVAFSGKEVVSVILPETVTDIKVNAFRDCTSLTTVIVNGKLGSIGEYAFGDCTALTTVIIKGELAKIAEYAFRNCSSLDMFLFSSPHSMPIGEGAFEGCGEIDKIYYASRDYYWESLDKESSGLSGNVYFYSEYEQTVSEYLNSREFRWHYDESGAPVFWINLKNDLAGKTFTVDYAVVTTTEWYWNMLLNLKNQNLIGQIADEELREIIMNSETKADFDAALSEVNSRAEATIVFGTDGTVTVYNAQNPEGYLYNYLEINDRVILLDPTEVHVLKGEFFVTEDGTLYEIQPMDEISSNETGEIYCYYKAE
jgi:hypothetical protein